MSNAITGQSVSGLDTLSSPCGFTPAFDCLERASYSGSAAVLASGTVLVNRLLVPGGQSLSHLGFFSGGTAAVTPSHWWMALLTGNSAALPLQVLAVTADQLTAPITAFSINDLPMVAGTDTPGTPQQLQFMYVALCVVAATVPTLESGYAVGAPQTAPQMLGFSSTGQTGPPAVGTQLAAITAGAGTALSSMWAH
jgi:hypothetical protein